MKKMICVALTLLLMMTVPFAVAMETFPLAENVLLTTTGNASVMITPDFVTVSLGVSTQAATVAQAQAENAAQIQAVINALVAQGVAEKDIQTSYFGVNPVYDYSYSGSEEKVRAYAVENNMQVIVRDIAKASAVLDAAMAAGANRSYGLNFDSSKRAEAYDQALTLAVQEAMRKAEILAAAAGKTLGAMLTVTEQGASYNGVYPVNARSMDAAGGTPIMSGGITVDASVTVAYQTK